jgi:glycosyltransferase involved in cell wall biosynthesis
MRDSGQSTADLKKAFYVKHGYSVRQTVPYFVDALTETQAIVHQPEVYPLAAEILRLAGGNTLVDLGCGRAQKLRRMHPEFDVVGVDFGDNLEWCKTHHPFGRWVEHDFERGPLIAPSDWNLASTGVICSDVIEHLVNPEPLLETVSEWLNRAPFALFSTPERDLVRGVPDMGPPSNPHHVREWNLEEFRDLLMHSGMDLWASGLTVNNNRDWQKKTIAAIVRRKGWKAAPPAEDFRVLAIVCAYNEADVIEHTLHYLTSQGIRVVLIDNWSTDETAVKARQFLDKGLLRIEKFPVSDSSATMNWHDMLRRVEEVGAEADADWIIHHDADEIREAPWKEFSLKEALYQVDREGYNCINHTCVVFHPTSDSKAEGGRVPDAFRYFEFGKRPGHFVQRKAWKKQPARVNLADSGGHDVTFPNRRVYPLRFLLKHYPIRSQQHGVRKVLEERIRRWDPHERQERGWHSQYDQVAESLEFVHKSRDLISFDPNRFEAEYLAERLAGVGITERPPQPSTLSSGLGRSEQEPFFCLDILNGVVDPFHSTHTVVMAGSSLVLSGWAADGVAKSAAGGVEIVLDGTSYRATYGLIRPDVSAHFHSEAYTSCGFEIVLPFSLVNRGAHELTIRVISADKEMFYESVALKFIAEA